MPKKIELLAPAGTPQALEAAVNAGADAVYLGSTLFSARAFAGNFDHTQLQEAVTFCHQRGVKVYVTLNTLLFESEIDHAMAEASYFYHLGVDALLVQDLGLFHRLRVELPEMELHASTQMHVHNAAGCRFLKKQGASRVVLARETPLAVVKECVATGMPIEIFCYGALCISYSGQCLMSADVKNRSGNRGMCAQMCRLRYHFFDGQKALPAAEGEYLLSPRDLNLINHVGELIDAGVSSLKIEGRMKRPEYVYLAVKTFREAIDAHYQGKPYVLSPLREKQLRLMFNRDFTEGHLYGASLAERMSPFRPNHRGVPIGRVLRYEKGRVLVQLSDVLHQHDGLRILNQPVDTGLTAVRIEKNGKLVSRAEPKDCVWLDCRSRPVPQKGQILLKTSDSVLLEEIRTAIRENPRRRPVKVRYEAKAGQPLQLWAALGDTEVTASSSQACAPAQRHPLTCRQLEDCLAKTDTLPFQVEFDGNNVLDEIFLPVSILNAARRSLYQKLAAALSAPPVRPPALSYAYTLKAPPAEEKHLLVIGGEEGALPDVRWLREEDICPVVQEEEREDAERRLVISQPGDLEHVKKGALAGMTLNATNSYALAFLLGLGCSGVILSSEVPQEEIRRMLAAFASRYGFTPCTYQLVYGRRTLMVIKGGFAQEKAPALIDMEGRVYPLRYSENLTKILAPEPCRSANRCCYGSLVIFTGEERGTQEAILQEAYEEIHSRV